MPPAATEPVASESSVAYYMETYIFVALIYWAFITSLGRYGEFVKKSLYGCCIFGNFAGIRLYPEAQASL
ncbi:MAG: hypothetical protein F4145_13645 [Boseongicola sp. SB0675_bin_26]|nr:hypothetical protein [Boseongicola sp. SB0675_bin_26]